MSFDAGALIFKIKTAGYQTFEQQMDAADRKVQGVGKSGAEAAPKVERAGKATEDLGKKAQSAKGPLEENAKSTKKVGDESATSTTKQEKQKYTTEQQADAAKKLSTALTLTGVAIAAVVGLSVAKWTEFDKAMSNTSAAVMATAQEQRDLSEAALQAGADSAYSATEAANAQEELAKAGMEVSDIIGGSLNGALALAAAGQLEVARSAEIMATTLKQYKLPAEQAAHVSDVLAAGAGKAQGSVDDLALALSYVGPVAAGLGISLEETGGSIAYLASQGILGEKAGTGLRGVLMSLTAPSKIATETMAQYGIEIFDAQGKMKSLAEVSQILKARLGGLTEAERSAALGRIFGNEQITTARILYEGGAAAIEEWTDKVNDSGYAAEQAAMRQDNLAGDIEKLGGAFETALIRTGSGANDVLREMVQSVTALVDCVRGASRTRAADCTHVRGRDGRCHPVRWGGDRPAGEVHRVEGAARRHEHEHGEDRPRRRWGRNRFDWHRHSARPIRAATGRSTGAGGGIPRHPR
ncbi:phage tail tape measure protein [Microbacterium lacticum]